MNLRPNFAGYVPRDDDWRRRIRRSVVAATILLVAPISAIAFVATAQAAYPGTNGKIAFSVMSLDDEEELATNSEIFATNPDGSEQVQLTDNDAPQRDIDPAFSPDGKKIAFASNRDHVVSDPGDYEIYVMDADGGNQTRITFSAGGDSFPTWSPDGARIAFVSYRDGNGEIYVMNADGSGAAQNLTKHPNYDYAPAWSPAGTKIAFQSDRTGFHEIYVMNADGLGSAQKLTEDSGYDEAPAWSPDGKMIAYGSYQTVTNHMEIFAMDADGSNEHALTNGPGIDESSYPAWSPDGTKIAFHALRHVEGVADRMSIYAMNAADGSDQTAVAASGGDLDYVTPDWQPLPVTAEEPPAEKPPAEATSEPQSPAEAQQASTENCAYTLRRPRTSVTHWKGFNRRTFVRFKVAPGGYVLKPNKPGRFTLQTQTRKARDKRNAKLTQVVFSVDGEQRAIDRRAPFTLALGAGEMTLGEHGLKAKVHAKRRKPRTVSIKYLVSNCESAAFSASMISKVPGKPTDLELRAQTGAANGPALKEASFALSRRLKVRTRGLKGKRVGTVELQGRSGAKTRQALKITKSSSSRIELRGSGGLAATLRKGGTGHRLELSDLGAYQATGIRVQLRGRRTGLLTNPRSCVKHRYAATLVSTDGQSVKLGRTLQMCKKKLGLG